MAAGYPRLVKAGRGPQRRPELRRTGLVVVGLAVLAGLVVAAVPALVLDGLYGDAFDGQAGLVRVLAIVAALSSVVSVATYALLAVGSRLSLLPWVGAAVQLVVIAVWHDSALQVATASAAALALTLLASMLAVRWDLGSRARHERTS
jgi:O-antigen/teichoic acid export membrane protein